MSNDTPETVDVNTDDLDAFNLLMNGTAKPLETVEDSTDEDIEDDTLATEDDDSTEVEDQSEDESEANAEEEEEPEPKPEKKKSRFQERIDELTADKRSEREAREALQKQLDDLKARYEAQNPAPTKEAAQVAVGPQFTDVDDDGEEKYPLGEYDPMYIRDLAVYEATKAIADLKAKDVQDAEALKAAEQEALTLTQWQEKLPEAREKYEEYDSSVEYLTDTFRELDPDYGNYLASTIMSMEYGPDVLYYLANNITEAKKIASSGPTRATIALGRLEALFALDAEQDDEPEVKQPKVSSAPKPAPVLNKGVNSNKGVRPDTDDRDAFETMFYKKKK